MSNINIEFAVLGAFLASSTHEGIEELQGIYLNTAFFSCSFTKSVASIINKLNTNDGFCDDLAVEYYIKKTSTFNQAMWIDLISRYPLIAPTVKGYLRILGAEYAKRRMKEMK